MKSHACTHSSSKSNIANSLISYNICNLLTVLPLSFSYLILWPSHLWKHIEHYALLSTERRSPILLFCFLCINSNSNALTDYC